MTGFAIKMIAASSMLIDHVGVVFAFAFDAEPLRVIGRISFPLYAFLLAEGARHTRDMKKYLLRLLVLALVSELPFDVLFFNAEQYPSTTIQWMDWNRQNVFFTLFLGCFAVYWYENVRRDGAWAIFCGAGVLGIVVLGGIVRADYSSMGVALIFLLYLAKKRRRQMVLLAFFILFTYGAGTGFQYVPYMLGASLSLVCVALYNGKEGPKNQWFFYSFYPAHILALIGVYQFLLR